MLHMQWGGEDWIMTFDEYVWQLFWMGIDQSVRMLHMQWRGGRGGEAPTSPDAQLTAPVVNAQPSRKQLMILKTSNRIELSWMVLDPQQLLSLDNY